MVRCYQNTTLQLIQRNMCKLTVITLGVVLSLNLTFSAFMKNKYAIEAELIEPCPNNAQIGQPLKTLSFLRYNKTHKSLNLEFTYSRDLDEKIGARVVIEKWGNGGWIRMPSIDFQPNICEYFLEYFAPIWINFHKNAGVAHPDRCPIPAGNYSTKNFMMDTTKFDIPFFSGRFRITTMYIDAATKQAIYCILSIVNIIEMF